LRIVADQKFTGPKSRLLRLGNCTVFVALDQ
jgi:hypothetical protein